MNECVAIIGMSGRFPGARNIYEFWDNLKNGRESIKRLTEDELKAEGVEENLLHHPNYVKAAPVLEDIDKFDAEFFGINPREAELMDPQHRLFLECAWEALENCGYISDNCSDRIGVFAGTSASSYLLHNLKVNHHFIDDAGGLQAILHGFDKDHLTTRVSYKLNLRGPSLTVQSACSSSLVSVSLACQSLLNYQCDMALAGGVAVNVPQKTGYMYQDGGVFSPDGHCRAFDKDAKGTVFGSGVGIVVLKRLEDAIKDGDAIDAVIRGFAINNDGSDKVGYTAPGIKGQAEVITEAIELSEVDPKTIGYIEAHGTGTPMGDPIEVAALTDVFRAYSTRTGFCALGSVKSNVGHLNAAAGIAGLIKTVMALKHKQLPPSLHFNEPNPQIDFENSPFYVNTSLKDWETKGFPRRAGVSSFGMGGTNAHVILEEAPKVNHVHSEKDDIHILVLSAKTESALETSTRNLIEYLNTNHEQSLENIAFTLQVGRKSFEYRRMVVCKSRKEAMERLKFAAANQAFTAKKTEKPPFVTFMFPGQGSQYVKMAMNLYNSQPIFRQEMDKCCDIVRPLLEEDLIHILYKLENGENLLNQTRMTQPALFIVEYALAKFFMNLGIKPNAMIGHSVGEYTAACLSGVMSLEHALELITIRGSLIQKLPKGDMLVIPLSEKEVEPWLTSDLSLAAINGPSMCVVSGTVQAVKQLQEKLIDRGINSRILHTSHAFHSHMLDPVLDEFRRAVSKIRLNEPNIPYISNVTGQWIRPSEATDPEYWVEHMRHTVQFSKGLKELFQLDEHQVFLEVGPGKVLSTLLRQNAERNDNITVLHSLPHAGERDSSESVFLESLGRLWLLGADINWSNLYRDKKMQRVSLPTYPFEKKSYWFGAKFAGTSVERNKQQEILQEKLTVTQSKYDRPNLYQEFVAPRTELEALIADIWQEVLGIKSIGVYDNFFELGGHSLLATQLLSRIKEVYPVDIPMERLFHDTTIANLSQIVEEELIEKMNELTDEEAKKLFQ